MTSAWLDQGGWQDSLIVHRMTRNTQPAVCLLGSVTCAAVSLARHGHTRVRMMRCSGQTFALQEHGPDAIMAQMRSG
eukprot:scaffold264208_cov24-Tisochrysis_lutea.AAC.1